LSIIDVKTKPLTLTLTLIVVFVVALACAAQSPNDYDSNHDHDHDPVRFCWFLTDSPHHQHCYTTVRYSAEADAEFYRRTFVGPSMRWTITGIRPKPTPVKRRWWMLWVSSRSR
jgi:hypothetical protein